MQITYLGHSAFKIETIGKTLYIDPWILGNPKSPIKKLDEIKEADYVLITHEHSDHGLKDGEDICRATGAKLVAAFETAENVEGIDTLAGNTGGKLILEEGLSVHFTHAFHATSKNQPVGFVIESKEGTVYHAGDTALFGDMALIGQKFDLDYAILPIGDVYTMGPEDATIAVDFLDPKKVIPMHYGTFPLLTGTVKEFEKHLDGNVELITLASGETTS